MTDATPGETIKMCLEIRGWTQNDLALETGYPLRFIEDLCSGRVPIIPTVARVLGEAFGGTANDWLDLQERSDKAQVMASMKRPLLCPNCGARVNAVVRELPPTWAAGKKAN